MLNLHHNTEVFLLLLTIYTIVNQLIALSPVLLNKLFTKLYLVILEDMQSGIPGRILSFMKCCT